MVEKVVIMVVMWKMYYWNRCCCVERMIDDEKNDGVDAVDRRLRVIDVCVDDVDRRLRVIDVCDVDVSLCLCLLWKKKICDGDADVDVHLFLHHPLWRNDDVFYDDHRDRNDAFFFVRNHLQRKVNVLFSSL